MNRIVPEQIITDCYLCPFWFSTGKTPDEPNQIEWCGYGDEEVEIDPTTRNKGFPANCELKEFKIKEDY